jgi:hypothetical protein
MTLSPDAVKAYEEFETALENLMRAAPRTECLRDDQMTSGWIVILERVRWEDADADDPEDDELDPIVSNIYYSRRGQTPGISRALAEQYVDECRKQ